MKVTYKKVVDVFEKLCNEHYQVKSFVNNHPLQINGLEVAYPVIALYPGRCNIRKGVTYINIKLFAMDLATSGYSNEKDALSSMLLIINDFIKKLYQSEDEYGFVIDETTVTGEPFAENIKSSEQSNIEDDVAGWYFSFDVEIQDDFNSCDLPFEPAN